MTQLKTFKVVSQGQSFEDAFEAAKETALREHGHSTPILYAINYEDRTPDYRKKDGDENLSKEVEASETPICLAAMVKKPLMNTNKIKSSVNIFSQEGPRTWHTKYGVYKVNASKVQPVTDIEPQKTKGDAIKEARKWTGKNKQATIVKVGKYLANEDDVEIVAEISYKKSSKERLGTYIFYGKVVIQ